MWHAKGHSTKRGGNAGGGGGGNGLVAVAIDKDKGSQSALRCAIENLHNKGHPIILIHVVHKSSAMHACMHAGHGLNSEPTGKSNLENMTKSLFLTFHCYCTRKDVQCYDVILEDHDVAKAITEYVNYAAIEVLVLGAPSRHTFMRKFKTDIPSAVAKGVPDFCRVYVVSKGKATLMKQASRPAPFMSPLLDQIQNQFQVDEYVEDDSASQFSSRSRSVRSDWTPAKPRVSVDDSFRSPFARGGAGGPMNPRSFQEMLETDRRPSTERSPHTFNPAIDPFGFDSFVSNPRMSTSSDTSYASSVIPTPNKFVDLSSMQEFSFVSQDSARTSVSSQHNMDEMEAEMKRLKLELKNTMEMYSTACKEAISAKQKAREMQRWKNEEEQKLEEAKNSEEAALSSIEEERARCKEAVETAEAAQKVAEMEAQKRMSLELKTIKDAGQLKKAMSNIDDQNDVRYRRYAMEDIEKATNKFDESKKIGEGGYGPVFKCYLDHTPVAVKVLRPDAVQGRSQFQREVEVLSMIRHPNMVLLLGACPEFGILVYEHMARGSLEDCLFRKNNVPPLSWQLRFKIAAEIATGLLFLHQTKPEPLVHRDLKPGNILLDINFVSKISDVGLARLVPAHVAENVTQQYHMTSAAGTFCYIDPEYQQTGMLGVKSDVYSFGIILLQLITARPPMGLSHLVETALENDTLADVLDKDVVDWPMEETLTFAKFALQCAELRRKDRPDLGSVVLPVLNRLREMAEENMGYMFFMGHNQSPAQSFVSDSMTHDVMSDPQVIHSGVSSKNPSPASSQVKVSMGASG
ncbi:U-box domain-containing protein 51 [Linum perenne]